MKRAAIILVAFWLSLAIEGCGSNPSKTQRPDLLDDKVTAGRVDAALRRGGPAFDHVSTQATGGHVTLTGQVSTAQDKSRAEEIARSVERVHELQDKIQVKP
jgi:osmotically-inducible protein OsmY